jgi:hypothetical protein
MTFKLRFTELAEPARLGSELRIDPVLDLEPGDILLASRTGERMKVDAVDGAIVTVERAFGPFKAIDLRKGDEMVIVGSVFSG